jgi:hypothetical protein
MIRNDQPAGRYQVLADGTPWTEDGKTEFDLDYAEGLADALIFGDRDREVRIVRVA